MLSLSMVSVDQQHSMRNPFPVSLFSYFSSGIEDLLLFLKLGLFSLLYP